MLKDIQNTIKQSAIYGISRVSSKLTGIILLPLYTSFFTIDVYGVIVRLELFWQLLFIVLLFGMENGVIKWYLSIKEETERRKFLYTICIFLAGLSLVSILFFFFFSDPVSSIILGADGYGYLIFLTALIASVEVYIFIIFLKIRIDEKPVKYTVYSLLITVLNLAIQLYYLFYTDNKLEGIFYSKIIAPLVICLILTPTFLKSLKIGFVVKYLKEVLKFSFPLLLGALLWMLIVQLDRYMLGYLSGPGEVGVYGFAVSICGLINFIIIFPFYLAFATLSWKKLKEDNAKRFFTKTITYLFLGIVYFSLVLSLLGPYAIKLFISNESYLESLSLIPIIGFALAFQGIHFIGVFSFQADGKTKYQFYSYLFTLCFTVAAYAVFIPLFSTLGTAFTTVLIYIFLNIVIYSLSKRSYFFNYEIMKIVKISVVYGLIIGVFFLVPIGPEMISIALKVIAIVLFPFILYVLKFYEEIELTTIRNLWGKYILRKG